MARRDPTESNEERAPKCSAGKKLLARAGHRRWTSNNQIPMIEVFFVCVRDLEGAGEEGFTARRSFATTDAALPFLDRLVMACGWREPYDPDDDDELARALDTGPCLAVLERGEQYVELEKTLAWTGPRDDEAWAPIIERGRRQAQGLIDWLNGGGGTRAPEEPPDDHPVNQGPPDDGPPDDDGPPPDDGPPADDGPPVDKPPDDDIPY